MGNYIFWSETGSGFGELGCTTPPRIPRSAPPPQAPPWNCVEQLFKLLVENNKHSNFEWRGHGRDRYILFCSPKLPCLNNFIPDCKPSFGLPLRMNGMHRTQFFFSTYHSVNFILLISLLLGSPGFISLLVSSGLPCQLTIICKHIPVLYYILAK